MLQTDNCTTTYLVLTQVIWKVRDHDLGLRWDTIFRRATLLAFARLALLTRLTGSAGLRGLSISTLLTLLFVRFSVRSFDKRIYLAGYICGDFGDFFRSRGVVCGAVRFALLCELLDAVILAEMDMGEVFEDLHDHHVWHDLHGHVHVRDHGRMTGDEYRCHCLLHRCQQPRH